MQILLKQLDEVFKNRIANDNNYKNRQENKKIMKRKERTLNNKNKNNKNNNKIEYINDINLNEYDENEIEFMEFFNEYKDLEIDSHFMEKDLGQVKKHNKKKAIKLFMVHMDLNRNILIKTKIIHFIMLHLHLI